MINSFYKFDLKEVGWEFILAIELLYSIPIYFISTGYLIIKANFTVVELYYPTRLFYRRKKINITQIKGIEFAIGSKQNYIIIRMISGKIIKYSYLRIENKDKEKLELFLLNLGVSILY